MKSAYKIRLIFASIIFVFAMLGISGVSSACLFDIQFALLLQRVFVNFSIIVLILFLVLIFITLDSGRIYCSMFCPYGFLQEFAALILYKKKNKAQKNYPVKYFIAAITFGALAGGSVVILRYIEPYTYFGSLMTGTILGITAFLLTLMIVFFKNRYFCTNICPVGAILGLLSKFSFNKIYIADGCVSCGQCEKNCPSGCINSKEKIVDNETCVRCLKCLDVCPKKTIKFGRKAVKFNPKRRDFVIGAAALAVFGAFVKAGIVIKDKAAGKFKDIILPPGAVKDEDIINRCFNCNLCVANCPNKIITKADGDFPVVHIDYDKGEGYCKSDCSKCGEVCPSGAIKRLKLEDKQKTRIAMAMINNDKCNRCGLCAESCPYGAIIKLEGQGMVLNASKCIGCGKCRTVCNFGAIEIFAVKEQKMI